VGCNDSAGLLQDTVIGLQDYWRQLSANTSILAGGTAIPNSFLRPVVGSASLLSATAMLWRLALPFRKIRLLVSCCSLLVIV